jgi:RHS repeat-associated protein
MTMGTTTFVWDPVFDCVSQELDENNDVKAVYHNEPQQYGGVLSQRRGTTSHYHHHDALGSTRFLTDSSGNVTDTYLNDAWGNSVASTGTTVNPFKWVGKYGYYTDDSTGQVYVRARMYQPTVVKWTSIDAFMYLDSLNLYQYGLLSPTQQLDASGQSVTNKLSIISAGLCKGCGHGLAMWDYEIPVGERIPAHPVIALVQKLCYFGEEHVCEKSSLTNCCEFERTRRWNYCMLEYLGIRPNVPGLNAPRVWDGWGHRNSDPQFNESCLGVGWKLILAEVKAFSDWRGIDNAIKQGKDGWEPAGVIWYDRETLTTGSVNEHIDLQKHMIPDWWSRPQGAIATAFVTVDENWRCCPGDIFSSSLSITGRGKENFGPTEICPLNWQGEWWTW